jgi:hypothetical protein
MSIETLVIIIVLLVLFGGWGRLLVFATQVKQKSFGRAHFLILNQHRSSRRGCGFPAQVAMQREIRLERCRHLPGRETLDGSFLIQRHDLTI